MLHAPIALVILWEHLDEHGALGERRGRLDCLDQAWQRRLLQHDAVDDDLDVVLVLLVELEALVEAVHLAVDAHA